MGLFDTADIENAADDPFALKPGRQEVRITKSEEDEITLNAGGSVTVWRMEVTNEQQDLSQEVLYWMEGDEQQLSRTHSNIKKMLVALEIPTSEWADISVHPEKLVGYKAVVNAVKAKSGKIFVNWVGVPVPETAPSSIGMEVFAGASEVDNRVGF
jgi:hypothetical protein